MSTTKPRLEPGPGHPITIAPTGKTVVVRVDGRVIAQSDRALTLEEASYGPVQYLPLEDVDATVLKGTEHTTYCPYKGDASYYSVTSPDRELENVVWTYEQPFEAVADIAGHAAFYTDRLQVSIG